MNIPEGFAQVNFKFTGPSAPTGAEVTLGLELVGVDQTPAGVASTCRAAWDDNVAPNQVDDIMLSSVLVKFGPNDEGPFFEDSGSDTGGSSSSPWSPAVAILVRKVTTLGGRKHRGRMFVPGYPENLVNASGDLETGVAASLTTNFTDFYNDLVAADLAPVVLHNDPIELPTIITNLVVASTVGTQRRRQRR